ncbi:hypothetical protein AB0E67_35055 [Streptomyces sp. NPDC032161]|uniref:hypothetical protein n=1 Tax=unclassified Streptomyces TaxID=2593676 RepID=UPI003403F5ED
MKVNEWLPDLADDVSVDDFITQIRAGAFGEQNSKSDLRAGLQRLADAGLIDPNDETSEDGPLTHLLEERIRNLPPYLPPTSQNRP